MWREMRAQNQRIAELETQRDFLLRSREWLSVCVRFSKSFFDVVRHRPYTRHNAKLAWEPYSRSYWRVAKNGMLK